MATIKTLKFKGAKELEVYGKGLPNKEWVKIKDKNTGLEVVSDRTEGSASFKANGGPLTWWHNNLGSNSGSIPFRPPTLQKAVWNTSPTG